MKRLSLSESTRDSVVVIGQLYTNVRSVVTEWEGKREKAFLMIISKLKNHEFWFKLLNKKLVLNVTVLECLEKQSSSLTKKRLLSTAKVIWLSLIQNIDRLIDARLRNISIIQNIDQLDKDSLKNFRYTGVFSRFEGDLYSNLSKLIYERNCLNEIQSLGGLIGQNEHCWDSERISGVLRDKISDEILTIFLEILESPSGKHMVLKAISTIFIQLKKTGVRYLPNWLGHVTFQLCYFIRWRRSQLDHLNYPARKKRFQKSSVTKAPNLSILSWLRLTYAFPI